MRLLIERLRNYSTIQVRANENYSSSEIELVDKVCILKAMIFPVVTYGCESWTIKKAESRRTDIFNCSVGEDS